MRGSLVLLLAGLTSSCLTGNWNRTTFQQVVEPDVLEALPPSGVELATCLDLLGAPTLVFENEVHGLILAYLWQKDRQFGFTLSVPVTDSESVSFSYTDGLNKATGIVLWFDDDWILEEWRQGQISNLLGAEPPRPATLQDIEATP